MKDHLKSKRKRTKHERNKKVIQLYETEKFTLRELAARFDVSHERIHQILTRAGVDCGSVAQSRNRKHKAEIRCKQCQTVFWVRPSRSNQQFCSTECATRNRAYSRDEILDHLVHIYKKYGKITSTLIQEEAPPSYPTVWKRFESMENVRRSISRRI